MARSGLDAGERVRLAPDSLGSHGNGAWPSLATLFSGHSLLFFTATPGTGSITFSGDSVPEGGLGYVDLTVNGAVSCEVLYQQGDLPWDFAHRLATAINNGCTTLISASVDSFYMGASEVPMVMTATTSGASTNYSFSIAYRPGDDPFFTLTPSGSTLTGGHN